MSVITRFEDLIAWQEARKLTKMIHALLRQGPLSKDYGLCDQLRRASTSVMTNIAEGFDCESRIEFARFLVIARRSAVEVQSLLYTALDDSYIIQKDFEIYYAQANRTKNIINSLKRSLNIQNKWVSEEKAEYMLAEISNVSDVSKSVKGVDDTLDTSDTPDTSDTSYSL